ncbi:hypothetical protein HA466_0042820 [Hirschfeldia incana]|nr:hypothetical protein HA466_0042820 [Hirschfeldia incana]
MGNYASCALSNTTSSSSSSSSKVILPDGEVRHIHAPTKAAEIMMEIPSFFLVDAKTLKIGRKLSPLAADDDLEINGRHVYVALPMTRATSAANASDMARLFLAAKKRVRTKSTAVKHCHNGKISPETGEEDDVEMISAGSKLSLEDIDEMGLVGDSSNHKALAINWSFYTAKLLSTISKATDSTTTTTLTRLKKEPSILKITVAAGID